MAKKRTRITIDWKIGLLVSVIGITTITLLNFTNTARPTTSRVASSSNTNNCPRSACPIISPVISNTLCHDGTLSGHFCERDNQGSCSWSLYTCPIITPVIATPTPTPTATPTPTPLITTLPIQTPIPTPTSPTIINTLSCQTCPDPAPGMPNFLCPDGTIGGPICQRQIDGQCGWSIRDCRTSALESFQSFFNNNTKPSPTTLNVRKEETPTPTQLFPTPTATTATQNSQEPETTTPTPSSSIPPRTTDVSIWRIMLEGIASIFNLLINWEGAANQ